MLASCYWIETTVPFALRAVWYEFLSCREKALELAGLGVTDFFTVEVYNRLAGTDYAALNVTPDASQRSVTFARDVRNGS